MVSQSGGIEINSKRKRLIDKIFRNPKPTDIRYEEVKSLLIALGAKPSEKGKTSGSRVAFFYMGKIFLLHKPHPESTLGPAVIQCIKDFLLETKVVTK